MFLECLQFRGQGFRVIFEEWCLKLRVLGCLKDLEFNNLGFMGDYVCAFSKLELCTSRSHGLELVEFRRFGADGFWLFGSRRLQSRLRESKAFTQTDDVSIGVGSQNLSEAPSTKSKKPKAKITSTPTLSAMTQ